MSQKIRLLKLYNRYTRLYRQKQSLPGKLKKVLGEIEEMEKEMGIK